MSKKIVIKIEKQEFDYDKLAEAIVRAEQDADTKKEIDKKQSETIQREEVIQKRKEILKEKDFSHINCKIWKQARIFFNTLRVFKNMLFVSKKNIKYFSAVDSLINIANSLIFRLIRLTLYLVALFSIILIFFNTNFVICIAVVFVSFTVAQLIRIAENEVENMSNREYAMAIFSGLISIMSLIVSVISILIVK